MAYDVHHVQIYILLKLWLNSLLFFQLFTSKFAIKKIILRNYIFQYFAITENFIENYLFLLCFKQCFKLVPF